MQFQTLITILPFLISLTNASPIEATALTTYATANADIADKVCFFGACIGGSQEGKSKCNVDQCLFAAAPTGSTCFKAVHKKKTDKYDKMQCGAVIMNMVGNSPQACSDCVGKLVDLVASVI
ncbi:Ribosomal RNA small subunit methyltransferase [Venturia nashicola]|uniref:Ribosomal RNA small subunit methyltransferase n=1 Tax=Venturia nashicola TaxID=86259 RepID=A0A4Z1PJ17_9PEZI|nr:Ribosomal RNA small subunit methyltransferase [Venturia nashicola]TLD39706.1 Ribosomal RNA small subunit methyltransferase [Venturia nashicola]